ncbi:hypothetical protein [Nocardia shimofusensis]|uniref:hypothetical protein n=1 Tax=Nocardia shimofusensis TaxID=228596 RepID=UPI00082EBB6C|nr:hypothetical protein [Nocardia shimofusensis]
MIGDDNLFFLTTSAIRDLAESLREIPDLVDELAITRTGQARTGRRSDYRMHRKAGEQPLPYNPAAAQIADHMHATLVGWVRLVCEQRGLSYNGSTATAGLARWLESNIIAFAMTEGVEAAPEEIARAVRAATSIISPPTPSVDIDPSKVRQARTHRLNASGIATLAKELGGDYRTLTVRRIQTLRDAGKIRPVPGPWAPDWPEMFVVGEVLDQHLAHPRRSRLGAGRSAGDARIRKAAAL